MNPFLKPSFCFIFILFSWFSHAQTVQFEYEAPKQIPEKYHFSYADSYTKTIETLEKNKDKNLSNTEKVFDEFAQQFVSFKNGLFTSGNIYFNWKEGEEYVNRVFRKVAPKEIANDTSYHVYIVKDPSFNAFSCYDNKFFVHIGLLAYITDEAMLAGVLAHELGHYLYYHSFSNFVRFRRAEKASKSLYNVYGIAGAIATGNAESESRRQETEADELALELIPKAGYSLKSLKEFYVLMDRVETFQEHHSGAGFNWGGSTHPSSRSRAENVQTDINNSPKKEGARFLLSEEWFNKLKKKARYQQMQVMLDNGNYHDCIIQGFEYYLQDPDNQHALYFILEGIRRWQIFTPKLLKKNFITSSPSHATFNTLLDRLDEKYLFMTYPEIEKSKAKDLIDPSVIEFKTYGQAFDYFTKQIDRVKCTECLLSAGLIVTKKPSNQSDYLTKYISSKGKYSTFAKAVLNNNTTITPAKSGVLFDVFINEINLLSYKKKDENHDFMYEFSEELNLATDSILKKNTNINQLLDYDSIYSNFIQTRIYMDIINTPNIYMQCNPNKSYNANTGKPKTSQINQYVSQVKHEILNPAIWEYCNTNKINELKLIDVYVKFVKEDEEANVANFYTKKGVKFSFKTNIIQYSIGKKSSRTFFTRNNSFTRSFYNLDQYSTILNSSLKD